MYSLIYLLSPLFLPSPFSPHFLSFSSHFPLIPSPLLYLLYPFLFSPSSFFISLFSLPSYSMWCQHSDIMVELLPLFVSSEDEGIEAVKSAMAEQLGQCTEWYATFTLLTHPPLSPLSLLSLTSLTKN